MRRLAAVAAVVVAITLGACTRGQDPSVEGAGPPSTLSRCQPVQFEALDPGSGLHVLPGGDEPRYGGDPPTSGPHTTGRFRSGVHPSPIPFPVQVGMLESGMVLLQYRDLSADERQALEALAGDLVAVAPYDGVPGRVVATAWRNRQMCEALDVPTLREFVAEFAGKGTAH